MKIVPATFTRGIGESPFNMRFIVVAATLGFSNKGNSGCLSGIFCSSFLTKELKSWYALECAFRSLCDVANFNLSLIGWIPPLTCCQDW